MAALAGQTAHDEQHTELDTVLAGVAVHPAAAMLPTPVPVAGPSTSAAATASYTRELQDQTFDVDDDEFELEAAFGQPEDDDEEDDGDPGESLDNGHDDRQPRKLLKRQTPSPSPPLPPMNVFPENVADAMIDEVKEIGMFRFIQKYVVQQDVSLPKMLAVFGVLVPASNEPEDPLYLLRILKVVITRALRNRKPLAQYGTPSAFIELLRKSRNIVVLTGAGVSTNCGIPDFRSPTGIYARLVASGQYPELSDPQEMFDIEIFREMPDLFYSFAKELYPDTSEAGGSKRAGAVHHWIRSLETQGKLLRNYTQNIDTLEQVAGIEKVLFAHGSFATCSCLTCKTQYPGDAIREAVFAQEVPLCPKCTASRTETASQDERPAKKTKLNFANGLGRGDEESDSEDWRPPWYGKPIMKPDITFFGQALDDSFDKCLIEDREKVDLLIIIGTSLQVAPVSELLGHIPHRVPQILINRDPVPHAMDRVDLALLGDCDKVISWITRELEQDNAAAASEPNNAAPSAPERVFEEIDNIWKLEGANLEHRWIAKVTGALQDVEDGSETGTPVEA